MKQVIGTNEAPAAIGTYSQAVKAGNTIYFAGQIGLVPETMQMIAGGTREQLQQTFKNIRAIAEAAGGDINQIVKLNISLINIDDFPVVNDVMADFFATPYPARAVVVVQALPKEALVEVEAILFLGE